MTKKKVLWNWRQDLHPFLTQSLTLWRNKLSRFPMEIARLCSLGRLVSLLTNIRRASKKLPGTNTLAYIYPKGLDSQIRMFVSKEGAYPKPQLDLYSEKSLWVLCLFSTSSYSQVLIPVNNFQLLLKLEILDKVRLVTFHKKATQRNYNIKTGSY